MASSDHLCTPQLQGKLAMCVWCFQHHFGVELCLPFCQRVHEGSARQSEGRGRFLPYPEIVFPPQTHTHEGERRSIMLILVCVLSFGEMHFQNHVNPWLFFITAIKFAFVPDSPRRQNINRAFHTSHFSTLTCRLR